jgi:trehalose 6-phosphate synthase/phosphatase
MKMIETQDPKRLIVVSNRLPFQLLENDGEITLKESDGGLVSALKSYFDYSGSSQDFAETWWIGSAEFPEKRWKRFLRQRTKPNSGFQVEPIFIEKSTYSKFYNGFCNATLWPLFHYFPSFVEFDENTFKSYEAVNASFSEKLIGFLQPGDILWIHDYQLMLLPQMIRDMLPEITIGFFLHIPFPSFEVFRMLHRPWKEKIIHGLLGADLVGFHTHEYVQHFLKSVQMVTGHDYQFRTIFMKDRVIKTDMFPLGIDFDKFNHASKLPEVVDQKKAILSNFTNKRIIFSVDRLDYTKGITHRLSGYERFLEKHPEWREKVVFILVVVPSRQIVSKYNERKKLIEEQIGRINGKHSTLGWQPLIYRYNHLTFAELTALYQVADVGLITPLRDGMNLVAKEYVASQDSKGVLILSELAGAANEMGEALLVNPMDQEEVSQAIHAALTMNAEDQKSKIQVLQKRLRDYNVVHWVNDFLKQLSETKEQQLAQRTRYISASVQKDILNKFNKASRRHLFLDYDGTLVPFTKHPKLAVPDKDLIKLLQSLSADPATDVTIVSGRTRESLEEWFGDLPINLIAEHGAATRIKNGIWKLETDIDQSWKPIIRSSLELFTQRSPGAFIEEKNNTLAWHYRNVDSELGFIRSRELLDSLHHMIRNAHLQIIDGNKVIEVRVSGVDKGTVTRKFLDDTHYDFILAVGDDKTDEDMFRALADKGITIKIGSGHSLAQYNLSSQNEILSLLRSLANSFAIQHA